MVMAKVVWPRIFCRVRMLPPFMTKWLAKVCRSTCDDWPAGTSKRDSPRALSKLFRQLLKPRTGSSRNPHRLPKSAEQNQRPGTTGTRSWKSRQGETQCLRSNLSSPLAQIALQSNKPYSTIRTTPREGLTMCSALEKFQSL